MAFKWAVAASDVWPPERNATPGTAAGTARKQTTDGRVSYFIYTGVLGTCLAGDYHVGLEDHAFGEHALPIELIEYRVQHRLSCLSAPLQSMVAVHEDLGLDDGDQAGFLT